MVSLTTTRTAKPFLTVSASVSNERSSSLASTQAWGAAGRERGVDSTSGGVHGSRCGGEEPQKMEGEARSASGVESAAQDMQLWGARRAANGVGGDCKLRYGAPTRGV